MRTWKAWLGCLTIMAVAGFGMLSLSLGQGPAPVPPPTSGPSAKFTPQVNPDLAKLPVLQQQLYLSARAGKEWLGRYNRADGRFFYGLVPSLRVPLTGDNYLHQAAAAFALARAAQFFKEEGSATVARQALLTLLLETQQDPKQERVRYPAAANSNPLAAASWLVLAINELPAPGADLLEKSEELCHFIRSQQKEDGSFVLPSNDADATETRPIPGLALYALIRSQQHRPAPWKLEAVRKGRDHYQASWRKEKYAEMVPWHSAAYAEAYLTGKEPVYAQCVEEMNDWICTLQYRELNPQRLLWNGGFKKWDQGQVQLSPPDVHSAIYLEGLGQACRVAKDRGDLQRYQAYSETCSRCAQFLTGLQYTEANAQHFDTKYRSDYLLGGFHPTHQDGTLRLDYTQEAVCGLIKCLTDTGDIK